MFSIFQSHTIRAFSAVLLLLAGASVDQTSAATSVTQFGITWNFSQDRPTGQYANGDWWVVGPVTITSITPNSVTDGAGWTKNGTMINPAPGSVQGFDSSIRFTGAAWNPALNVSPSFKGSHLVVAAGSSVVSVISKPTAGDAGSRPQLTDGAILTVVASAPEPGSFRPPMVGTDKTHRWNKSSLKYGILQKLAPVAATPSLASVESMFERPWFAQMEGSPARYIHPENNMPEYERDQAQMLSLGLLSLHLNYSDAQKEKLYIRLVQYGIDVYGSVKAGTIYFDNGALNAGRKAPVVLAGLALGDADILKYADATKHYVFQEDRQTWFVTQADVGRQMLQEATKPRETYSQSHVGMPEWGEKHSSQPTRDDSRWGAAFYRWVGGAWLGNILMAHLTTGGVAAWNHPPLFAYSDRYWSLEKNGQTYTAPNAISPFVYQMWAAYRGSPPPAAVGKVETPQISPIPGHYDLPQTVRITTNTAGATIRYTTNGSEPTASSTIYSTPLTVASNSTVKARAFKTAMEDSASAAASYTFGVAAPTITPNGANVATRGGNLFFTPVTVSMNCATSGATIYYTTDGSRPTAASQKYTGPFDIVSGLPLNVKAESPFDNDLIVPSVTVTAIALKSGVADSTLQEALFNFGPFPSGDEWTNIGISPRVLSANDTYFKVLFDYVPGDASIDGVVGLSDGEAQAYKDLACIVRFNNFGKIDARNGGAYAAVNELKYAKGIRYRVEMTVDMVKKSYSAKVLANPTVDDAAAYVDIAKDYSFRTEQSTLNRIGNMALCTVGNEVSRVLVLSNRPNPKATPRGSELKLDWTP